MTTIYHSIPENMEGTTLYPLNELADLHRTIFAEHQAKYAKRPKVLVNAIPRLGCFWSDVLHFIAVHPSVLKTTLERAGITRELRFVEVEAEKLQKEKTIVFLNKLSPEAMGNAKISDFAEYDPGTISLYGMMPLQNEQYYKDHGNDQDEFLLYHNIPHILYKGSFDIKGLPIITL